MRHRDKETVLSALEDWKALRERVATEGGENYERPVLVKFLDSGTFEVMERDIVEDEFYVLRKFKIMRELAPDGKDLQDAIREAGREAPQRRGRSSQSRGSRGGKGKGGSARGSSAKAGQPKDDSAGDKAGTGNKRGSRRRGRRTGRRGGKRGSGSGGADAGKPQS